jgi:hypothetical protein
MGRPMEGWLPVVGYEGQYEVSDQGQVRSVRRVVIRSNGRPYTVPACILKQFGGGSDDSHQQVKLYRRKPDYSTEQVATLVLTAFEGSCPPGMEACHNDGNPFNNRRTNLRWDTRSENTFDMVRHGTHNMARKTRCPKNHPYDAENTRYKGNRRVCRRCEQEYRRRRKGAA